MSNLILLWTINHATLAIIMIQDLELNTDREVYTDMTCNESRVMTVCMLCTSFLQSSNDYAFVVKNSILL